MPPEAFTIAIPDPLISDMRARLRTTKWADDFDNDDWSFGVEGGWLREMVRYWADDFDWRAQEAQMNRLPHFRVTIDGVPIHFIHVKGRAPNPKPLVLTHGWPWTFWDWKDVIGPLADPAGSGGDLGTSFDVVIPSLPGFAFSSPLRSDGLGARQVAGLWDRLMRDVLGYRRYGAVGGDLGAAVTGMLGLDHPDSVLGILLTVSTLPGVNPLEITDDDWADDEGPLRDRLTVGRPTTAHVPLQGLIPQTLAFAFSDTPMGAAAWFWQKRWQMSDFTGDMADHYGRDLLCTLASTYWLTNTVASSFRAYAAFLRNPADLPSSPYIETPTGFSIFPKDVAFLPRSIAQRHCNLKHWSVRPKGGHYASAEQPWDVVNEIRAFFSGLR